MDTLELNKLADAREFVEGMDRLIVETDIVEAKEYGIDLEILANDFVNKYPSRREGGTSSFIWNMKNVVARYRRLTQPQVRAVLNIMQEADPAFRAMQDHQEPNLGGTHECFICHETFGRYDDLVDHKAEQHDGEGKPTPLTESDDLNEEAAGVAVIAKTDSTLGLDLSGLPDGRYAFPNSRENDGEFCFLFVKRLRKTVRRNRRYVYGKILTGDEVVPAGTIEVKVWSSDSRELIGEQKPGDVYRGEREQELQGIMMSPEVFAILFGKMMGHCCICGKKLTDDESRAIGMGLECERKTEYWKSVPKSYVAHCPVCPDSQNKKPGKIVRFHYDTGDCVYSCLSGHRWKVDKKGNEQVLT